MVDLGDADWAELVAPVSPLRFDNPITVTVGETTFPEGPIELPADQVAGYLGALVYGQDDLDRLDRQQLVWRTWLQQIAESGAPTAVPATTNGLGPYIKALTAGPTSMATLDVVPAAQPAPEDGTTITFDPQVDGILEQVTDAVPGADIARPRRPVRGPGAQRANGAADPRRPPPGARDGRCADRRGGQRHQLRCRGDERSSTAARGSRTRRRRCETCSEEARSTSMPRPTIPSTS